MTSAIYSNLSSAIDSGIVKDLLQSYDDVVSRYRKFDVDGCLSASGRFVENTLRAIEYLRTGKAVAEIKSVSRAKTTIENDTSLPEPLRVLVPRVALSMIYDIRSKTGAVHVKEIDPRHIDASLAVHAASWVVAEFIRQFHTDDENEVAAAMASLMRTYTPFIESFGDEEVVTREVSCELELLLLLANSGNRGLSRKELGKSCQHSPSSITRHLQKLISSRLIFLLQNGRYRITGPGEKRTSDLLSQLSAEP